MCWVWTVRELLVHDLRPRSPDEMRLDKAVVIATDDAIIVYHPFTHPFFRAVQSSEDEKSLFAASHTIIITRDRKGGGNKGK